MSTKLADGVHNMSWIRETGHEPSTLYRSLSLSRPAWDAAVQLDEAIAAGNSALTRVQEEAIAVVVSVANSAVTERWPTEGPSVTTPTIPSSPASS
jgi:alkylhydroperoxidase family enzyme